MIKVLFISHWYPNRYDNMLGSFVQKHAEAVSLYCEVKVLYIIPDENIDKFEFTENTKGNLSELLVYFPFNKNNIFYKYSKTINYLKAYWKGIKQIQFDNFKPDIIHANILTRTGFIAYLIKRWKGIPYIITEHWTRYLPDRKAFNGLIRKFITKVIVKNASAVLPVSIMLKKAMLSYNLMNPNYVIVDNVIDPAFFETYPLTSRTKKRIILVSCFLEEAKNVSGIIRAIAELSAERADFELIIIGTGPDFQQITDLSDQLNLTDTFVRFLGEKTSEEVAEWVYNSDFFVLFSNYETAGIVIAESLALGKPILTTKVGIAEDYVNDSNGIIIDVLDETALLNKMNYMLDNFQYYDSDKIRTELRDKFSYENIGKQITDIYQDILKSKHIANN